MTAISILRINLIAGLLAVGFAYATAVFAQEDQPIRKTKEQIAALEAHRSDPFDMLRIQKVAIALKIGVTRMSVVDKLKREYKSEYNVEFRKLSENGKKVEPLVTHQLAKRLLDKYTTRIEEQVFTEKSERERFNQIRLQYRMRFQEQFNQLNDPEVARLLGLSERQKTEIEQKAASARNLLSEFAADVTKRGFARIRELLTEEQRKKLDEMLGEPPFEFIAYWVGW